MPAMKHPQSLGPRPLIGSIVCLEPLSPAHHGELQAAAADPALWRYMPVDFAGLWDATLKEMAQGSRIGFAVRRLADGAIVGSTSYLADVPRHGRVEIGATWYIAAAQGGTVNAEAKFLLLANAFEEAGYHRVELKTDATNLRSRAAILKLGAKEEGTLRAHMWMPRGYWRDTVYYSILASEWADVKARLQMRLGA